VPAFDVDDWFDANTSAWTDHTLEDLLAAKVASELSVSLVVPARNACARRLWRPRTSSTRSS